ncbi:Arc family DNA-binding protein [Rhizobium leguminosarum]|uniref:Arc family DNA-binding protein n=1 Tax=Rhizobium leguminosarum TaxID=384 RepID=UPI001C901FFA|nr:Arc family DNA-binding protein [Rhizobium leguminosarum]MBY2916176.1 Arc family DNA-binding protein [Rhizobium leguminosarum]MBY2971411.1 Arc family DNA-binding protein [Rhizobium leguminosarum]MBY2978813.1 Arc family DNA-binding protein [Rhizobium leguminosarum]MBY3007364.1 Arc family DNA-binding protein [Rhizobium leguminosarum]
MITQQAVKPFGLRMPPELKTWLDSRAEENGRSLNSEIVQMIKAAKQAEQKVTA